MSLRLEKQSLRVEMSVGENTAQSVVEGSVTISGGKPEIGRALRVSALPSITGYEVVEGRVAIEGNLDVDLLYASFTEVESAGTEGDEEPELILEERLEKASFAGAIPFAFVLDIPGAETGMQAQVEVTVESVNFEVQGDQRTVDVDVVLEFNGVVTKAEELVFTTRAITNADIVVEQKDIRLQTAAVTTKGQVHAEGMLTFGGRTLPEQVLDLQLQLAAPPTVRYNEGVAEVSGDLNCTLLYTAQDVGAAQAEWTECIPFRADVQFLNVPPQTKADVTVKVADVHWRVVDSDEARGLAVEATVFLTLKSAPAQYVSVVTGISADGAITVASRTEPMLLQEAVGEGTATHTAEVSLELPAGAAPVERVLLADAKARVEDIHVLGDKVAIEGIATLNLVYVGRSGDTTSLAATTWPAAIPFDYEIPVMGAEPGLERHLKLSVDRVSVDLINRETIDVAVTMTAQVCLNRSVEVEAVVEATEVPAPDPNPPTYTFVVLQEGDTLWQLAQRYHTDMAVILQANKWLESEEAPLTAGVKLCIPRRRGVA